MGAYFITGTGTDIGKTWLTCALLLHWRAAGREVQAFKPVLSGFDMATVEASDAGKILAALGRKIDVAALDEIAPWRFVTPLSPDMAAARDSSNFVRHQKRRPRAGWPRAFAYQFTFSSGD